VHGSEHVEVGETNQEAEQQAGELANHHTGAGSYGTTEKTSGSQARFCRDRRSGDCRRSGAGVGVYFQIRL
jgi:hypothetical protein